MDKKIKFYLTLLALSVATSPALAKKGTATAPTTRPSAKPVTRPSVPEEAHRILNSTLHSTPAEICEPNAPVKKDLSPEAKQRDELHFSLAHQLSNISQLPTRRERKEKLVGALSEGYSNRPGKGAAPFQVEAWALRVKALENLLHAQFMNGDLSAVHALSQALESREEVNPSAEKREIVQDLQVVYSDLKRSEIRGGEKASLATARVTLESRLHRVFMGQESTVENDTVVDTKETKQSKRSTK